MRAIQVLVFLSVLGSAVRAEVGPLPPGTALTFDEAHAVFGDVYQGETVEHRWTFRNSSDRIIRITGTRSSTVGSTIAVAPESLRPGEAGELVVRQPIGSRLGRVAYRYAVRTDEDGGRRHRLSLSGFAQSAYDPELLRVEFGAVDKLTGGTAEVELISREVERLQLVDLNGAPDFVEVGVPGRAGDAGQGITVLFSLSPGAPEGLLTLGMTLVTNVESQPELPVTLRGIVRGDVVPDENPIDLGVTEAGLRLDKRVRFRHQRGEAFRIVRAEDSEGVLDLDFAECSTSDLPAEGCLDLRISLEADGRSTLRGLIRVWLEGAESPITLSYRGLTVSPGTVIRDVIVPDPGDGGTR